MATEQEWGDLAKELHALIQEKFPEMDNKQIAIAADIANAVIDAAYKKVGHLREGAKEDYIEQPLLCAFEMCKSHVKVRRIAALKKTQGQPPDA
jgi:hypothetical protein